MKCSCYNRVPNFFRNKCITVEFTFARLYVVLAVVSILVILYHVTFSSHGDGMSFLYFAEPRERRETA